MEENRALKTEIEQLKRKEQERQQEIELQESIPKEVAPQDTVQLVQEVNDEQFHVEAEQINSPETIAAESVIANAEEDKTNEIVQETKEKIENFDKQLEDLYKIPSS